MVWSTIAPSFHKLAKIFSYYWGLIVKSQEEIEVIRKILCTENMFSIMSTMCLVRNTSEYYLVTIWILFHAKIGANLRSKTRSKTKTISFDLINFDFPSLASQDLDFWRQGLAADIVGYRKGCKSNLCFPLSLTETGSCFYLSEAVILSPMSATQS